MRRSRRQFLAAFGVGASLSRVPVAAVTAEAVREDRAMPLREINDPPSLRLLDLQGGLVDPFTVASSSPPANATVFLFVSVSCPISNRYAPLLRQLHAAHSADRMSFWLVYPNPAESAAMIERHVSEFAFGIAALRDPGHELVQLTGVTVTPEAAVYDRRRQLAYRGRIDNRHVRLGLERTVVTEPDLADALEAIAAGRQAHPPRAGAVGCYIADFIETR
jgi:hypothetical protein